MSRAFPSFLGVLCSLAGAMALAALLSAIGVAASATFALTIAAIAIGWLLLANFTSPHRPAARQVLGQDVQRMHAKRMTPTKIARDTRLETHQLRQILAGDDQWWVQP